MNKFLWPAAFAVLIVCVWPYKIVVSPVATLRVVDEQGLPLRGMKIARECESSEGFSRREEGVTDVRGEISFKRIDTHITQVRRAWNESLYSIPAVCALGGEMWGKAQYEIYWPAGFDFHIDDKEWTKKFGCYVNRDGINLRDPHDYVPGPHRLRLYTFRKTDDFAFTVKLHRTDGVWEWNPPQSSP